MFRRALASSYITPGRSAGIIRPARVGRRQFLLETLAPAREHRLPAQNLTGPTVRGTTQSLVIATVGWLPLFDGQLWVIIIGWWEVAIGIVFLFRRTIRVAIALLALQMVGTFMPLILLPAVTFQAGLLPYGPTMEGQYIIKNLMIISAALVVGGTVRRNEVSGREDK